MTVETHPEVETLLKSASSVKLVTVMRVKDEESYIEHSLRSLEPLGGQVVLLDDGSTDATADIARSFGFVDYRRQDDLPMDEGRDRTALYRWALEYEPEWIFTLDGDEVLDPPSVERMLRAMKYAESDINVFGVYLAVMASKPDARPLMRYNGAEPHGYWYMDRMFRVRDADRDYEFTSNFENNLHCGCVPAMRERKKQRLNVWIQYYGYESPAVIEKKRAFYREHDPVNFPRVEQMWEARMKCGRAAIRRDLDAREMGITRTVTY